jgi:arylsulfatase
MVNNSGSRPYQGYLRDDCVTIAEVLRAGGYRTLMSGKWHCGGIFSRNDPTNWRIGDPERPLPPDRGFDEWWGTPAGAGSYFNPRPLMHNYRFIEPEGDRFYYTDAISEQAARMIGEAARHDQPFFLHVSYTAPHWPLHAHEEDVALYQGRYREGWDAVRTARHEELKGLGILDAKWVISPRDEKAPDWDDVKLQDWEDRRMAVYAAQVARMDAGIGRIMAALRQAGVEQNTLVLFLSDNGGCAELLREDGQRAREWPVTREGKEMRFGNLAGLMPGDETTYQSYDLPWANASNTPFRLYKHWVHEGGISTPLVAYWPETVAGGGIQHSPIHIVDIMATFVDLAEAAYPSEYGESEIQPIEGESFAPALRGKQWERERPILWEHEGNCAVRDGRWKLVKKYPGDWELYDMVEDRTELNDLAEENKPQVAKMVAAWEEWAERCGVLPWEQLLAQRR